MKLTGIVKVNSPSAPVGVACGDAIPIGQYFTGDLNDYGQALYLRTFSGFVKLTPTDECPSGQSTWNEPRNVEVRGYQPVDVEITYAPCR